MSKTVAVLWAGSTVVQGAEVSQEDTGGCREITLPLFSVASLLYFIPFPLGLGCSFFPAPFPCSLVANSNTFTTMQGPGEVTCPGEMFVNMFFKDFTSERVEGREKD